ncbi:MAG: hypothetical protein CSB48_12355 [Proteobacteria bacterium]|nr:MAG: hypothetical protein CSB48_12355 [Pseudomonadota bacterium]
MSIKNLIMPHVASVISSSKLKRIKRHAHELRRRITGQTHTLDVFIKPDDPYSYLLVQVLDDLLNRFTVDIAIHTVMHLPEEAFPKREMWDMNALKDARWLAELYQLDFPANEPSAKDPTPFLHALLAAETEKQATGTVLTVFRHYWSDSKDPDSPPWKNLPDTTANQIRLQTNERLLEKLGHYYSAMIYYAGEWYRGLDRLDHLESRLITLNASREEKSQIRYNKTRNTLFSASTPRNGVKKSDNRFEEPNHSVKTPGKRVEAPELSPSTGNSLELFFSARSPYSYLGLEQAAHLARTFAVPLTIKPVLPMVMRGMAVPHAKKMYIFSDTKREAETLGIPYGKVADPLGAGVERCYALYEMAQQEGKELAYLLSYARGVNAEGIRSETESGMKIIVKRAGLNWESARPLLLKAGDPDAQWRTWAQKNLDELLELGIWGVPGFRYNDLSVWGQDRLCRIAEAIQANK